MKSACWPCLLRRPDFSPNNPAVHPAEEWAEGAGRPAVGSVAEVPEAAELRVVESEEEALEVVAASGEDEPEEARLAVAWGRVVLDNPGALAADTLGILVIREINRIPMAATATARSTVP